MIKYIFMFYIFQIYSSTWFPKIILKWIVTYRLVLKSESKTGWYVLLLLYSNFFLKNLGTFLYTCQTTNKTHKYITTKIYKYLRDLRRSIHQLVVLTIIHWMYKTYTSSTIYFNKSFSEYKIICMPKFSWIWLVLYLFLL